MKSAEGVAVAAWEDEKDYVIDRIDRNEQRTQNLENIVRRIERAVGDLRVDITRIQVRTVVLSAVAAVVASAVGQALVAIAISRLFVGGGG